MKFLLFLVCIRPLIGHDMWIEPATFSPRTGDVVGVKLRVGEGLLGDPIPRDPALLRELVAWDSEGRKALPGRNGADPAGYLRVAAPGLHVVGYSSYPSPVQMAKEKFVSYLKEEGLDAVAARQGEFGVTVRELFTRCAKSLIQVGPTNAAAVDRKMGFTLELVAERNPYALQPGEPLPVRLTYQDRPLAGALVTAISRANPAAKVSARTGSDGRVRLQLRPGGLWMVKAVHMVKAESPEADWSSYWASLTFDLGAKR
jgi:uncharacterized GH25 family protein